MKRQSTYSWDQDQLKNAKPRESWDHTSPIGNDNTSDNNNQLPCTSTSDASISEHPVPSTCQSFLTYGTSECYNQIDQNQVMMQNQMPATTSSCDRNIESMSSDNVNTSNFKSLSQIQQTESLNTEGTACSPSPFAFQYSDEEAASLMVKLCNEDTFRPALQVLTSWLKNVEFTKSNSTYLFSLINCVQNSVWRMMNEKAKYKEELNNVYLDVSRKKGNISSQLKEISKVFEKAKLQNVWNQFTIPQKEMISSWMKETKQIMSVLRKESVAENSDPDEDYFEKSKNSLTDPLVDEHRKYKEELDSLNNQLKAIKDNIAALHNEEKIKSKFYEDTFLDMDQKYEKMQAEIEEITSLLEAESLNKNNENEVKSISSKDSQLRQVPKFLEEEMLKTKHEISAEEVYHVTLISSFLNIHPFGSNVDYISSCLKEFNPKLKDCLYIENLMCRFPRLFREESRGEGANLTKEWVWCMFD